MDRRDFIKKTSILGLGTLLIPNLTLGNSFYFQKGQKIKLSLIGLGTLKNFHILRNEN